MIKMKIDTEEKQLKQKIENYQQGGGTTDHSRLNNLDYESSGHTGFQPAGDYIEDSNYVHTDNNFTDEDKQQILDNTDRIDTAEDDIDALGIEIDNLDANKVPTTRKINNKQLNQDITLTPSDIGIGNVFTLKGSVATTDDLPSAENQIGDVYYVESEEVGYIWLEKQSVLQWEQLGLPIDLSNYVEKEQISTITLTGTSGTLTDEQMTLILANKKNIVLNVGGDNYYLSNDESPLTHLTFMSIIPVTSSALEYKALYIQIDSQAVNYNNWNIEEITIEQYELPIATTETLGGIKPDGETITVDENGIASAVGGGGGNNPKVIAFNTTDYPSSNPLRLETLNPMDMIYQPASGGGYVGAETTRGTVGSSAFGISTSSTGGIAIFMGKDSNTRPGRTYYNFFVIADHFLNYNTQATQDASVMYRSKYVIVDTSVSVSTRAEQYLGDVMNCNHTATVQKTHTYNTLPQSSVVPSNEKHFTTKKYVDDSIATAIGNIETELGGI